MSGPPEPWTAVPVVHVGGLTDVGVRSADGIEYILTVTQSGRGLFDSADGLVARDRAEPPDDWVDQIGLEADGIGPLEGQRVRLAGLAGGGLPTATHDGWHITRAAIDWPNEYVFLEPPGRGVLWSGHEDGCAKLLGDEAVDLRAAGFSPTGRMLVLATAADLRIFVRD